MPHCEDRQKLLNQYLRGRIAATATVEHRITPRPAGEAAPLSFSQEELVRRETSTPGISPLYNECIQLRMAGTLDASILERSLAEIISRHEIWRTSYTSKHGQLTQVVHTFQEPRLPVMHLAHLSGTALELEIQRVVGELIRQPFDLENNSLVRFQLIRTGNLEHRLFVIAHLSVVDGLSAYQILPCELAALYRGYALGETSPFAGLAVQYGDYAYWQRQWFKEENLTKQVDYWCKRLAGVAALRWPSNRPRPAQQTFRGAIHSFVLPQPLSEMVKAISRQEGVTVFVTLLATFAEFLHRHTQEEDIVIGTPSPAGRKHSEVEKLLGYFLNPVALRFDLTGSLTFRQLLRQAHHLAMEAISYDDVPLELVAQRLNLTPGHSRNPFFNVAMSLQPPMADTGLGWNITSMDVSSGGAPWDLYIAFIERPNGIIGRVQYDPDLFDSETIEQMLGQFQQILGSAIANPGAQLCVLETVPASIQ